MKAYGIKKRVSAFAQYATKSNEAWTETAPNHCRATINRIRRTAKKTERRNNKVQI